ncbi:MAG: rhomboid family intramembrane serine protease [Bacteroidia bacterium]|nr:rhomboid family intramembrane serine protease [Bacteroidia bacterium]
MFQLLLRVVDDILWPAVFIVFFWVLFFANEAYSLGLNRMGVQPHEIEGLLGILFMPFLHGDFSHLFSNTIPFLVAGSFIFHFYGRSSWSIFFAVWLFSGLGVWLFGAERSIHIGASGMVYGMVAFLLTTGFIRKNKNLTAVAFILVFLYGSMIWGLFPQYSWIHKMNISWEGHLFGTLTGIAMAFLYRHRGPEDDKDPFEEDEVMPQWWIDMENEKALQEEQQRLQRPRPTIFRIVYRPKDKDEETE